MAACEATDSATHITQTILDGQYCDVERYDSISEAVQGTSHSVKPGTRLWFPEGSDLPINGWQHRLSVERIYVSCPRDARTATLKTGLLDFDFFSGRVWRSQ